MLICICTYTYHRSWRWLDNAAATVRAYVQGICLPDLDKQVLKQVSAILEYLGNHITCDIEAEEYQPNHGQQSRPSSFYVLLQDQPHCL